MEDIMNDCSREFIDSTQKTIHKQSDSSRSQKYPNIRWKIFDIIEQLHQYWSSSIGNKKFYTQKY